MADVVEQDKLIEIKGTWPWECPSLTSSEYTGNLGRRPYRLGEVFPRPPLDGKRLPGDVEIHQNGLRFTSMGNQRLGMHIGTSSIPS